MSEAFILCENLVKFYKIGELEVMALQGLDLTIESGELTAIVGASGSGKTTLMNILGGLDRPSAGKVWVNGRNLLSLSDAELTQYRRQKVGFVWQQAARNLLPYLTAQENVEIPMTLSGKSGRVSRSRAEKLLQVVGLVDRRHHTLSTLSGGEQQRVAIGVALANEPSLVLADEPTGEVDTVTSQTIYQAFQELNREFGVTTLIVSHDPAIARQVRRVVGIRDGKTSSETLRREPPVGSALGGLEKPAEEHYEELVVLDTAGRLQVPKEYLDRFQITNRAKLEVREDGILILPAPAVEKRAAGEPRESSPEQSAIRRGLAKFRLDRKKGGR